MIYVQIIIKLNKSIVFYKKYEKIRENIDFLDKYDIILNQELN